MAKEIVIHKPTGISVELNWDLVQRSEEWFAARWGYFGGTGAKELSVENMDKDSACVLHVINAETEKFVYDESLSYVSKAAARGVELEPVAFQEALEYTDLLFEEMGWMRRIGTRLGLSPDGLTRNLKDGLEIKCLSANEHNKAVMQDDYILKEYNHQIAEYFASNPFLERVTFFFYRPEHKFKAIHTVDITLNSKMHTGNTRRIAAKPATPAVEYVKSDYKNGIKGVRAAEAKPAVKGVEPQPIFTPLHELVDSLIAAERKCEAIAQVELEKMSF